MIAHPLFYCHSNPHGIEVPLKVMPGTKMVDTLNTKPPGTFDKATPPKATAKSIRFDLMKTPPIEIPVERLFAALFEIQILVPHQ